jgi:hypothetical protein
MGKASWRVRNLFTASGVAHSHKHVRARLSHAVIVTACMLIAHLALPQLHLALAEEGRPKIIRVLPPREVPRKGSPDPSANSAPGTARSEIPNLIAEHIQGGGPSCGDHALQILVDNQLIWVDFAKGGQKTRLSSDPTARIMACSPDGRWVIMAVAGDFWSPEDCPTPGKGALPILLLWDMVESNRRIVGEGVFEFGWNPRGDLLVYRAEPYCGLPEDKRAWLKLPEGIREFKALSVRGLAQHALNGVSGWVDNGLVGAFNWLDSDRLLVQLAEHATGIMDASLGAIVLITRDNDAAAKVEQLNPSKFRTSWKLAVPQIRASVSDEIVHNARCEAGGSEQIIECYDKFLQRGKSEGQAFRPERFCRDAGGGDADRFCDYGGPKPPTWTRVRRGSYVHVVKTVTHDNGGISQELYVVDNDAGGYLH